MFRYSQEFRSPCMPEQLDKCNNITVTIRSNISLPLFTDYILLYIIKHVIIRQKRKNAAWKKLFPHDRTYTTRIVVYIYIHIYIDSFSYIPVRCFEHLKIVYVE